MSCKQSAISFPNFAYMAHIRQNHKNFLHILQKAKESYFNWSAIALPTKLNMNRFIFVQSICWSVKQPKRDDLGLVIVSRTFYFELFQQVVAYILEIDFCQNQLHTLSVTFLVLKEIGLDLFSP